MFGVMVVVVVLVVVCVGSCVGCVGVVVFGLELIWVF